MFAQTLANRSPIRPFIILSSVGSTNNYAMAKLHGGMVMPGTCFLALEQTAGKGQRGHHWLAESGQNITMSAVFRPVTPQGFHFSAAMALGCYDFIKDLGFPDISVKWPNDVYLGDRKAAGILIENVFKGSSWEWAVTGVGLNLNQTSFSDAHGTAVSLKQYSGTHYDVIAMGKKLHRHMLHRNEWLLATTGEEVMKEYNSRLYKKGEEVRMKKNAAVFSTTIREVSPAGELVTSDVMERRFTVGEVEFVKS